MKAIRVHETGDPEVLRLEEVPDPLPGPGQLRVRVRAAGVNPVETYIRSGLQGYAPAQLPYTPGSDGAGTVDRLGEGVQGLALGLRVYLSGSLTGTYAEHALCTPDQVHPLPDGPSFAQGAAVGIPYATAYRALFQRARAHPGETVLVHGASGAVGLAAVQLAAAAGLRVLGSAGSEAGRRLVLEQGAEAVFDHHRADHFQAVADHADGRGVDLILEMLANVNLGRDLELLAKGGRVVVIGSRGPVEVMPRELMRRDAAVLGMSLFNADAGDLREAHAALGAALALGAARPVIQMEMPLAHAAQAQRMVMEGDSRGKIVLIPD